MKVIRIEKYRKSVLLAAIIAAVILAAPVAAAFLDISNPENQSPTGLDFPAHPANYYNVTFEVSAGLQGPVNAIFVALDQDSYMNPDNLSTECIFVSSNGQINMHPWNVTIVDPADEVPEFSWPEGVDQALKIWVPVGMIIPANYPVWVNITCGVENRCPINCSGDFVWVFTDNARFIPGMFPQKSNSDLLKVTVDTSTEGCGNISPEGRSFYFACEDATFSITPCLCNVLSELEIDDKPVELVNQTTEEFDLTLFPDGTAELTFTEIRCSHTVEAGFEVQGIGKISGHKFDTATGDGLADWEINLFDANGEELLDTALTNVSGYYEFSELCLGTYVVNETLMDGWKLVSPSQGFYVVTLTEQNPVKDNLDFINERVACNGSIFGFKLNQSTMLGLEGWEIRLFNQTGLVKTQVTDEDGAYDFTGLCNGTYIVNETVKEGWELESPSEGSYTVIINVPDQRVGPKNFVNELEVVCNATIFGHKLNQSTMLGLEGWDIQLYNGTVLIDTETTDEQGFYEFEDLCTGTYIVKEVVESGWEIVSPGGGSFTVTITDPNQQAGPKDFVNEREVMCNATIFGHKFDEETDEGLAGWDIQLYNGTVLIDTETTDEQGFYEFDDLCTGTYVIKEVLKTGWEIETPPEGSFTVSITDPNQTVGPKDFYNEQVCNATIFGHKLDEETEEGLAGWEIKLFMGATLIDTQVTGEDGFYEFKALCPGTYTINETLKEGWHIVSPEGGSYTVTITQHGEHVGPKDFVNAFVETELSGMKFSDVNQNGKFDPPLDRPLPNWTIKLRFPENNTVFMTTVTDENGEYEFVGIPFGEWKITEVGQPFWVQTAPGLKDNFFRYWLVELTPENPKIEDLDFGNKYIPFDPPFPTFGEILKNYTSIISTPGSSPLFNFKAFSARELLLGFSRNITQVHF